MNKLRDIFFEGLRSEKRIMSYYGDKYMLKYVYGCSMMDVDEINFIAKEYEDGSCHYEAYHRRINGGEFIFLFFSDIKYNEFIIKKLFRNLILTEKEFIEMKETIENNLNAKKLDIEL